MREIGIPLTIGITTWRDEKYIKAAIMSVIDFADFIVVAYGKIEDEEPDKTLSILRHLQVDYPGIITLLYDSNWADEAERLNATWFESCGFYFRLRGNEMLDEPAKKELVRQITFSLSKQLPITAVTSKSDVWEFRGCQVDYNTLFIASNQLEGIFDSSNQESLKMKCKVIRQ